MTTMPHSFRTKLAIPSKTGHTKDSTNRKAVELMEPSAQANFDAPAYLEIFYGDPDDTIPCMKIVLSYLTGIAARLEEGSPRRMIDIGSGPTVYMGFVFRNKVSEINFSDFSDINISELRAFKRGLSRFKWAPVIKKIALHEGATQHEIYLMEMQTRFKINKIYKCDVFNPEVLTEQGTPSEVHPDRGAPPEILTVKGTPSEVLTEQGAPSQTVEDVRNIGQFDLVTSAFCIEYAGETSCDYRRALTNVVGLLKQGGTLVLGGCLGAEYWTYNGHYYYCFTLTEKELMDGLEEAGIDTEHDFFSVVESSTFVIKGVKR